LRFWRKSLKPWQQFDAPVFLSYEVPAEQEESRMAPPISEDEVLMDENRNFDDHSVSETNRRGVPTGLILLLIGIGVGSLVAAMLTPKTGKQVRKGLRRRYEDARDTLEEWSDQAEGWMQRGSEWANAASSKVAPIARKLKRGIR
jgi:hypothetical protein